MQSDALRYGVIPYASFVRLTTPCGDLHLESPRIECTRQIDDVSRRTTGDESRDDMQDASPAHYAPSSRPFSTR